MTSISYNKPMATVSIIIPTLFPPPTLQEYVGRLAKYKSVKEVIIAINSDKMIISNNQDSSNDQSSMINDLKSITHDVSSIKVLTLEKNRGFTGACNAGTRAASGEYLLFLNDDCEMDEESFEKLVDFLENNPELVATQPVVLRQIPSSKFPRLYLDRQVPSSDKEEKILNQVQDDKIISDDLPTTYNLQPATYNEIENIGFIVDTRIGKAHVVNDLSTVQRILSSPTRNSELGTWNSTSPTTYNLPPTPYSYGLSGTCLLIRKDIFEKVKMFDESFHSYLEDVDLALKLRKFGYKFAPCMDSEVTHAHMATSKRMGMYKSIQDMSNWWRLILKHPDIFVHFSNLLPLLLERGRNVSGVVKKFLEPSS